MLYSMFLGESEGCNMWFLGLIGGVLGVLEGDFGVKMGI